MMTRAPRPASRKVAKGPANAVFEVAKFVFDDLNLKPADFAGAQ